MESLDVILYGLCVAIALALFLFSAFRLNQARTSLNAICASACTIFLAKTAISLSYFKVAWLNSKARYVLIYGTLNTTTILLYYLYERRLALFFRNGGQYFRAAMYLFIGLYAADTVALIAVFAAYAKNTASGGYTSDGPGAFQVKITNYLLDMAVGVTILAGTFFALGRLLENNKTLQSGGRAASSAASTASTSLYQIVIKSDCTKFAVVFAIEIYKAVTSTDPTNQTGALPTANNAFQHLIDAIKITIMVINLYLPSGLAKIASKASSAGGSAGQPSSAGTKDSMNKAPVGVGSETA
ncbi:hypothetical protein DFJ73DRAFT_956489 [Zopfochytrium polystomum]|nr:hypothetical protein DFJ73DRAFT_956489 [Zopfochytrium polystomum]